MNIKSGRSGRYIFMGMIIIALGITFSTTLQNAFGPLGTIFIAVGGLFFIFGMSLRKKEDDGQEKTNH